MKKFEGKIVIYAKRIFFLFYFLQENYPIPEPGQNGKSLGNMTCIYSGVYPVCALLLLLSYPAN